MARRLLSLGLWTIALFGLWLALVGTVAGLELIAGAVAALIGAIAVEVVRSRGLLLGIDPRWLAGLRRPLVQVFVDFFVVMGALARTLATRRPPDDRCLVVDLSGAGGDQRSPGWRAYAAAAGSLAPNSVVIDVERERRRMLVHKLVPESGPSRPL